MQSNWAALQNTLKKGHTNSRKKGVKRKSPISTRSNSAVPPGLALPNVTRNESLFTERSESPAKKRIAKPAYRLSDDWDSYNMPEDIKQPDGLFLVTGPLTGTVSMDCEFVGVGDGGRHNALARVSIVNYHGDVVYDEWVKPLQKVVDYRTWVSGVRASNLTNAREFKEVQTEVAGITKGRILIGHSIKGDLKALSLKHPANEIRDTARYKYLCPLGPISLKSLVKTHLYKDIQCGEHNPVEDSRGCLLLYRKFQKRWEKDLKLKGIHNIYTSDGGGKYTRKSRKAEGQQVPTSAYTLENYIMGSKPSAS